MKIIQMLRGTFAKKPELADGQMYVAKDTKQVFVGDKAITAGEFNIVEDNTAFTTLKTQANSDHTTVANHTTQISNLTTEVNSQADDIADIQADYMQTASGNTITANAVAISNSSGKLTSLKGSAGQYVGFNSSGVPAAVSLSSIDITVSSTQPTTQKSGDFWYQITGTI